MGKAYGTVCRVQVSPKNNLEASAAKVNFIATQEKIDTTASIDYDDSCLIIKGTGFDGRCSFCRYFRLALKRQLIQYGVNCPFEVITPGNTEECKVSIGEALFDQSYLEDESNLTKHLAEIAVNPDNSRAHTALGVLYEYRGQFINSITGYWRAYELDNENTFARARLKEILEFLIEILPDE